MNRFSPRATVLLILSANAPDIDIVMLAGGGLNYFHYHRHLSHSLLFAPVLAALVVAVVRIAGRKPFPLLPAFLLALVGLGSHLLLDLTNEYGIRLLLPFSGTWLHWDFTSVIDMWILAAFGFCLLAPLFSKLVGGEIGGSSRQQLPSRTFGGLALAFLIFYDAGRWISHSRAVAMLNARIYDGAAPLRVAAFPSGSNPLRWRGLAETGNAYQMSDLHILNGADLSEVQAVFKAESSAAIEAANRTGPFRIFGDFAQYPLWTSFPAGVPEGGTHLVLSDMRFGFFSSAIVDKAGAVQSSVFSFSR